MLSCAQWATCALLWCVTADTTPLRLLHGRSAVNSSTGRRNTAGGWSSVRSAVNSNTGDHATKLSSTLLPGLADNDFGTLVPVLVIVDQDHPNAADAPDCGIIPEPNRSQPICRRAMLHESVRDYPRAGTRYW